jgi:hypothetical protein
MQEEKENMVDIDTSGPGADVELPEEKPENEVETKEDSSSAPQESTDKTVEASDEKPEAEKPNRKTNYKIIQKTCKEELLNLQKNGEKQNVKKMKR